MSDLNERASAWLSAYDGFGHRRTGSDGDAAAARWLAEQVAAFDTSPDLIPVPFERFEPGTGELTWEGGRIEGLPLFDAPPTGPDGVAGQLGELDGPAPIGWASYHPRIAGQKDNPLTEARRAERHRAIVVALRSEGSDSLAPVNAPDILAPFGPPVLQVAGRDQSQLEELAAAGTEVQVRTEGQRVPGLSHNVTATLRLRGVSAPPLVVLTPRTSWWEGTAECGGGIVAWLTVLERLSVRGKRSRPVRFLATCGQELGHLGAIRAFAAEPGLIPKAMLVLHLGANLGAAGNPGLTLRSNVPKLAASAADLLRAHGYPPDAIEVATDGTADGEVHEIESRGGRYLSLTGQNPWFHSPEDRWPDSVDIGRVAAVAATAAALAEAVVA